MIIAKFLEPELFIQISTDISEKGTSIAKGRENPSTNKYVQNKLNVASPTWHHQFHMMRSIWNVHAISYWWHYPLGSNLYIVSAAFAIEDKALKNTIAKNATKKKSWIIFIYISQIVVTFEKLNKGFVLSLTDVNVMVTTAPNVALAEFAVSSYLADAITVENWLVRKIASFIRYFPTKID